MKSLHNIIDVIEEMAVYKNYATLDESTICILALNEEGNSIISSISNNNFYKIKQILITTKEIPLSTSAQYIISIKDECNKNFTLKLTSLTKNAKLIIIVGKIHSNIINLINNLFISENVFIVDLFTENTVNNFLNTLIDCQMNASIGWIDYNEIKEFFSHKNTIYFGHSNIRAPFNYANALNSALIDSNASIETARAIILFISGDIDLYIIDSLINLLNTKINNTVKIFYSGKINNSKSISLDLIII